MTIRYAPEMIERLDGRRRELSRRVVGGALSEDEAQVLFEHDVHQAIEEAKKPRLKILK